MPDPRPGQARTRRTRAAVVTAARSLFLEQGYAATTMAQISADSDTPSATVYRLFASKLGVLRSVLDIAIGGDDRPVAVADRPEVRALLSDPDATAQIAVFAAMLRDRLERTAAVHRILADAARADAAAADLLADVSRQRQAGQRRVAAALATSDRLRGGLDERDVGDLVHALGSPEVYGLLVLDRGWSGARYEKWLRELLTQQLLAQPGDTPDSPHPSPHERNHP